MAILPLAAAIQLSAGTIAMPTGNPTCTFSDSTHTNSACTAAISGSGGAVIMGLGGTGNDLFLDADSSVSESSSGTVSGGFGVGTSIPYSYDFSLQQQNIDPDWALTITVLDGSTTVATTGAIDGTYGTSLTEFDNSGTMTTTSAVAMGDTLTVEFTLAFTGLTGDNEHTLVEILPATSIDVGPVTTSNTPEPATFALMGVGLAALGFSRKLRKS